MFIRGCSVCGSDAFSQKKWLNNVGHVKMYRLNRVFYDIHANHL